MAGGPAPARRRVLCVVRGQRGTVAGECAPVRGEPPPGIREYDARTRADPGSLRCGHRGLGRSGVGAVRQRACGEHGAAALRGTAPPRPVRSRRPTSPSSSPVAARARIASALGPCHRSATAAERSSRAAATRSACRWPLRTSSRERRTRALAAISRARLSKRASRCAPASISRSAFSLPASARAESTTIIRGGTMPEAFEPGAPEPETPEPEATDPAAPEPDVFEPGAPDPATPEPGAARARSQGATSRRSHTRASRARVSAGAKPP